MIPSGDKHYAWRGEDASDRSKRRRVYCIPLGPCELCGKPGTDRHHKNSNLNDCSAENIQILCRSCHMKIDGRTDALQKVAFRWPPSQPKPCIVCLEKKSPLRRGRCHACNEYYRRHGVERSEYLSKIK